MVFSIYQICHFINEKFTICKKKFDTSRDIKEVTDHLNQLDQGLLEDPDNEILQ